MRIFEGSFSSIGATKNTWPSNRSWPTTVSLARFSTLTTRPSARPPAFRSVISTFTLSPFIAEPRSELSGMKMSLLDALNFFLWNHEPVAVAMNDDRSFDKISGGGLVAVSPMLGETSFFDELIQDVFDLLARGRRRIEVFENSVEIGAAIGRFLDVLNEIFGPRISRRRLR